MAKPVQVTFKMNNPEPKKHSVQFHGGEGAPLTSAYLMREVMKAKGIKDLDAIKSIEVTITVNQ